MISDTLLLQRGHLVNWVPVCLGIGIGGYFGLRFEPSLIIWLWLAVVVAALILISRFVGYVVAPVLIALALMGTGAGLAKLRAEAVRGPVIDFRYYGPIQGRVVDIDRSASNAPRLTLDNVVLFNMPPDRTPNRVRISVHGEQPIAVYNPGDTVILTGHLGAPNGPAEPGGFDFQRHAWFLELGAVGYTRKPVLRAAPPQSGLSLIVNRTRVSLSRAVLARMNDKTGAFAAAITTGDRSAIPPEVMEALRASNLAHLLAISGLHMGLLTGFIFTICRSGLALLPKVGLLWPTKKIAAIVAVCVGAVYLMLSGGNVATERAFIMVSVMFGAVLLDKRALTLRAVAVAATIVLVLRPEALTGPGFQMSFAATTALVWAFSALRNISVPQLPRWTRGPLSVVVSSAVAGLATAPIAAAHFNQMAHYGLFANVVSVPVMGVVVMPAAVLAACLAPFGLEWIGLWVMDLGLGWIIWVAETAAAQPGAVGHIPAPPPHTFTILCVGMLFALLWRGPLRTTGLVTAFSAFVFWGQSDRPDALVADSGGFIGILTDEGRAVSRATGHGFVSSIWLENDGAPVQQDIAAKREGIRVDGRRYYARLGEWTLLQVSGKTALNDLSGCGGVDILISNQVDVITRPCLVFDRDDLRQTGALAITQSEGRLSIQSARDLSGVRPWNAYSYDKEVRQHIVLEWQNGPYAQPVVLLANGQ